LIREQARTSVNSAPTPRQSFTAARSSLSLQRKCACDGPSDRDFGKAQARLQTPRAAKDEDAGDRPVDSFAQVADRFANQAAGSEGAETPAPTLGDETPESVAAEFTSAASLIAEDEAGELARGQMRKSEFLDELRAEVCAAADDELARVGRSTAGCPYIEQAFERYRTMSASQLERGLRRYVPQVAGAETARAYIPAVSERVRQGVATWATTGQIVGVPAELAGPMPGPTPNPTPNPTPAVAAPGGAPVVPAEKGRMEDKVFAKARVWGVRETDDPRQIQAQLGSGQALDGTVRSRMETAFGHDFSHVRVHNDGKAAALSSSLNARAFTIGSDVTFAAGEYRPGTMIGDALLAHELAHVAQQGAATPSAAPLKQGGTEYGALEEEADQSAVEAVVSLWGGMKGKLANVTRSAMPRLRSGLGLQRCDDTKEPGGAAVKQQAGSAAPAAAPCVHPVKPKSTQIAKDLDFGYRMKVEWGSSTGTMSDLKGCFVTEEITYSKIPNPPFGKADGKELPESGKTQRIPALPGLKAETGLAQDTHRHPRSLVRTPPSADKYTVAQTYDYNSPACGGKWIPFANYTLTYEIYKKGSDFWFKSGKTGTDGPFGSDEKI
jgi:uncharacterized protein DUF4157